MERDVGRLKAIEIPERLTIAFQRDLEVGNILLRREVGGVADKANLKEGASPLELLHAIRRRNHVPRCARECVDNQLRRWPGHPSPFARAKLDDPHLAQMEQRLPDGWPANAKMLHEIALGRQQFRRR